MGKNFRQLRATVKHQCSPRILERPRVSQHNITHIQSTTQNYSAYEKKSRKSELMGKDNQQTSTLRMQMLKLSDKNF